MIKLGVEFWRADNFNAHMVGAKKQHVAAPFGPRLFKREAYAKLGAIEIF